MARDAGSKPSTSNIPPNLRYSAIFCDAAADGVRNHVTLVTDATAAFSAG